MSGQRRQAVPGDLARAKQRFANWRSNRSGRSRIPQPLWSLAVGLAEVHGVCRTATVLGLDYYSLKKRCESSAPPLDEASAFVEFGPLPVTNTQECAIELEDGLGRRLRLTMKGYDASDVAMLVRGMWDPK